MLPCFDRERGLGPCCSLYKKIRGWDRAKSKYVVLLHLRITRLPRHDAWIRGISGKSTFTISTAQVHCFVARCHWVFRETTRTCLRPPARRVHPSPSTGRTPQPAGLVGLSPGTLDFSTPGYSSRGLLGPESENLQYSIARQLDKF